MMHIGQAGGTDGTDRPATLSSWSGTIRTASLGLGHLPGSATDSRLSAEPTDPE